MQILLGDLKAVLRAIDEDVLLDFGFSDPHSYRGMYDCVSFEPSPSRPTKDLVQEVFKALQDTYTGWKGGEFNYTENTPVFFTYEGCVEDGVGCHDYNGELTEIRKYFYQIIQEYKELTK